VYIAPYFFTAMFIHLKVFSLSCGLLWGIGIFCFTWWIILFEGATGERAILGRVYRGYTISPRGSIVGLIWGFFDGLLGGGRIVRKKNMVVAKVIASS